MKKCENPERYRKEIREKYQKIKRNKNKNKNRASEEVENYIFLKLIDKEIIVIGKVINLVVDEMENLAVGDIDELRRIQSKYETTIMQHFKDNHICRKIVEDFFSNVFINAYTNFSKGGFIAENKLWSRIEYVESFDINVCPYCNAQFILTIKSDNQEERINANNRKLVGEKRRGTSPELDHFLPKHKYPLFSMSAYNLVPSCKICNQSLKGEIEFNYEEFYSPFEKGIDDSFRFYRRMIGQEANQQNSKIVEAITVQNIPNYVNSILGISNDFTISIKHQEIPGVTEKENQKLKKKVENNIKYLRLEDIYNFHRSYLQKILLQSQVYNELYQYQLEKGFPKLFDELKIITSMVTEKDFYKDVILSKMVSEILIDELGHSRIEGNINIIERLKALER
ncbi:hypothetical protein [Paenibacillus sp. MMS20-IR301]|uniref:HNH endonuclease n=1 Tax=Paenibacillus sp. MMS20-IR301 TaxID=2895946 RepID=UPI0028E86A61|nr:hypothetical protein [Paenibacillus sp. MMS20-IR301]WNS41581.1 hypothetical protein LOS79_21470 [Paenibacillus sp. MMS20-IR301]